jgi:hypothetical protein
LVHYINKSALPAKVNGHIVTYQADTPTLSKQAADNPFTYGAMWKKPNNMGGMWLNYKVLKQNVEDDGFIILQFYGMSNSGKSWLAFAKAFELIAILQEHGFNDVEIHLVHNWSEVLHVMDEAKDGDIVLCDEETTISGQESLTEANSMKNILKSCRAKRISFFFIDPAPEPKPNIHSHIYVVGKIKGIYTTLSIVTDAKGTLVGLDFHPLPMNNQDYVDVLTVYEELKMANIDALLKAHGKVGSNFFSQQEKEARVLYELARQEQKVTGLRMTLRRLKVLMVRHRMTGGTGDYREQIQTMVIDWLKSGDSQMDEEEDTEGIIWSKESAGEETLPKDFHTQLEPYLNKWADKENISRDDIALMVRWLRGESQEILAEERDVKQKDISLLFKSINQRVLGYACEDWLAAKNPHWKHVGGNTAGIDMESDDAVISIKATSKRYREFTINETSLAERERASLTLKEFLGFMFHVRHNRIRKIRWTEKNEETDEKD